MNFERWCPQIHDICRNGFPEDSVVLCSMWDTVHGACIFVDAMKVTVNTRYFVQQKIEEKRKSLEELKGKD